MPLLGIIARLGLGGRDISDGFEQPAIVEPIHPFKGGEFDRLEAAPGSPPVDQLGLVEAVDGLGQRVVVGIADAADRGLDASLGQTLGVADRDVLNAPIAMVNEPAAYRPPIMEGLHQGVEHKVGVGHPGHFPADDPAGESIDDKGDINEPAPGRDIGKVGNPQGIGPGCLELAIDPILRTGCRRIAFGRLDPFAPDRALHAHFLHQPLNRAAGHVLTLAPELAPDLARPVDLEVGVEDPADFLFQPAIAPGAGRGASGFAPHRQMGMVGRRGDRQNLADRLDPVGLTVIVDERDHGLNRRSSSAWAKYADALRRISLA